jgi:hypothetical protein
MWTRTLDIIGPKAIFATFGALRANAVSNTEIVGLRLCRADEGPRLERSTGWRQDGAGSSQGSVFPAIGMKPMWPNVLKIRVSSSRRP